jgi:hypothetical protein
LLRDRTRDSWACTALTRLPVLPRIHPLEAARIVTDYILPHFEIVSITTEDYLEALNTMAADGSALEFTTLCC